MLRLVARCLPVIIVVIAGGAAADPTPEQRRIPDALSDMQAARLLIRAGRLDDARTFLEQAEPADEKGRIERLFALGRIEMRLGLPAKAAQRFEAILAIQPALTRVRLELAHAYLLAGLDDKAREQFRSSLAHELPSTVEAAIDAFLRRIDSRKRWSVSVSAAALPETKRPQRETVLVGGVPFRLDEEARSGSGTGVLLSGGASYSPPVGERLRGVLATSAASKSYERSSWNETTVAAEAGVTRLFEQGSASGGMRVVRLWTAGDPERWSLGPWARLSHRFSKSTRIDVALDADHRRHDEAPTRTRNGWRVAIAPRLAHAFGGQTSIEIEPTLEVVTAKEDHHASRLTGVGATLSHTVAGGMLVSLSASTQVRRHSGPDPLFGSRRVDKTLRVTLKLRHRSWRWQGLRPYVGYSLERTRSTIPVHESRIQGLIAGASFGH